MAVFVLSNLCQESFRCHGSSSKPEFGTAMEAVSKKTPNTACMMSRSFYWSPVPIGGGGKCVAHLLSIKRWGYRPRTQPLQNSIHLFLVFIQSKIRPWGLEWHVLVMMGKLITIDGSFICICLNSWGQIQLIVIRGLVMKCGKLNEGM